MSDGPTAAERSASSVDTGHASEAARLARANDAYDVGDFAAVRGLCASLRSASDRQLAARALLLAAKVEVEPSSWFAVACCSVLVVGIVVTYAH